MFTLLLSLLINLPTRLIIFDAGSSGTRIYLYEYYNSSDPSNFTSVLEFNSTKPVVHKEKIPLTSLNSNSSLVSDLFDPCFNYVKPYLTEYDPKNISIILYATAGMRGLSLNDQKKVLDLSYNYISTNFQYSINRKEVRVIEGYEEALFAWIAVNRLQNLFDQNDVTIPIFEIGGASSQVATEQSIIDIYTSPYTKNITIGQKNYSVFAHSWLGYGADLALNTILSHLYNNQTNLNHLYNNHTYLNPCQLKNSTFEYTINSTIKCNFTGTGDFERCYKLFSELVYIKKNSCGNYDCLFENIPLSKDFEKKGQIFGMGIAQYQREFLHLPNELYIDAFKKNATNFALLNYSEAYNKDPNYTFYNVTLAQQQLVLNFLERGLLMKNSKILLSLPNKINEVEPQWTLGAVLVLRSPSISIDPNSKTFPINPIIGIGFIVIIIIFIIFISNKSNKHNETLSTPLVI